MKKYFYIFIIIFLFFTPFYNVFGETNKNILIIGSYNLSNEWEKSVISGFRSNSKTNLCINTEFLDIQSPNYFQYIESFNNFINLKYKDKYIDCILTIDDEAFDFVRGQLNNKDSIFYKKKLVFVGCNKTLYFSDFEKEYITGILEPQDNFIAIDIILKSNDDLENIYLILDNNTYSQTTKDNILAMAKIAEKNFNVHVIKGEYLLGILNDVKQINHSNSAIYLCGSFKTEDESDHLSSDEIIKEIKRSTKTPIFTKLKSYVDAGAIGGIVNDGNKLGSMASNVVDKILEGSPSSGNILPSYNTVNMPYFNYDALRAYNINPLILPENSIIINKGPFELLVPKYVQNIIWIIILLLLCSFIYFIIIFIKNKRLALESEKLLLETIERNNIKTDFILTLSHELRTPLNVIINSSKLIELRVSESCMENDFFYKQLNFINKNSHRLLKLVNNLIDASKLDSGYMDTLFTMENIVEVIEEATLSVVDLAKTHKIDVVFDTEEEEIFTAIDKSKIERIMLNLLSNSIKFTNENGTINVNISTDWSFVKIIVKDNGIGMSLDLKTHLFQKFKREQSITSLRRDTEGSGLGLFIVKGLVELHNGFIEVESELNQGTSITISLPIVKIDTASYTNKFLNNGLKDIVNLELSDVDNDKKSP
ncbi:MAG: ATP-binding protein [Clostridium sp.]